MRSNALTLTLAALALSGLVACSKEKTTEVVDPSLSVGKMRSMDSIVGIARAREGFVGALLLLAGTVALFLGVVAIYGSVAHSVRRRTREDRPARGPCARAASRPRCVSQRTRTGRSRLGSMFGERIDGGQFVCERVRDRIPARALEVECRR